MNDDEEGDERNTSRKKMSSTMTIDPRENMKEDQRKKRNSECCGATSYEGITE